MTEVPRHAIGAGQRRAWPRADTQFGAGRRRPGEAVRPSTRRRAYSHQGRAHAVFLMCGRALSWAPLLLSAMVVVVVGGWEHGCCESGGGWRPLEILRIHAGFEE